MIDLHMHTKFSDGTDSIEELMDKWIDNDLKYVSITDHDTIDGVNCLYNDIRLINKLKDNNITFIHGVEFSSFIDNYPIHLLGYGFDLDDKNILNIINRGKQLRFDKFKSRLVALKEQFNIEFSENSLKEMSENVDFIGKPIMARYMLKDGICETFEECFKKYLNNLKLKTVETRINAREIIPSVIDAHGICVWAHPLGGIGEDRITFEEVERIIQKLLPLGLKGLECYYNLYTLDEIEKLVSLAHKYNLYISAGSDYHGDNKRVKLKELCLDGDIDINNDKANIINYFIYEKIRYNYKPDKVKILFVGESRPISGKFFYIDDTQLYLQTKEVFDLLVENFTREKFKDLGCWLYDVCEEPINQYNEQISCERATKMEIIRKNIPRLKNIINKISPENIIIVKKGLLSKVVLSEILKICNDINVFNLPFPSCGNQIKYKEGLVNIMKGKINE